MEKEVLTGDAYEQSGISEGQVNSLYFNCQSIQLLGSSFASFDVRRLEHGNRLSAQSKDQVNSLLLTCE